MGPIWTGWARRKSPLSQQRAGLSAHRLRAQQQPSAGQNKLTVIYCPLPLEFLISAPAFPRETLGSRETQEEEGDEEEGER